MAESDPQEVANELVSENKDLKDQRDRLLLSIDSLKQENTRISEENKLLRSDMHVIRREFGKLCKALKIIQ